MEHLELSQPGVSKHLTVLREAGLVAARRDGNRRLFALRPGPLAEVGQWRALSRVLVETPSRLERHLEGNP